MGEDLFNLNPVELRVSRDTTMDGRSRRPTEQCLYEGMPSQSEAPSGRGKSVWLLCAAQSDAA